MKIDSYSFGNITVDGNKYTKDLLIFPDRVKKGWWRKKGHQLTLEDMEEVLEYGPEMLVVGTGAMGLMKVGKEVTDKLDSMGIEYTVAKTADAVEEYNKVCEDRKVVFAAHLTC